MIADLKPYKEYKEAGLPWLDSIPRHWNIPPNRGLMQEQRRVVGDDAKDHTLLSLTLRGVIARDMVNPKGKFPAQFNTYKLVERGDLVFCLFDIDETPRGVGLSPLNGMITGAYDVFKPRTVVGPRFLYYYYLYVDDGKLMKPFYTGLRKTIQRGVFSSLKAPCPPRDEQMAIVRFLDWTTGRLERAIRAKRQVIALLNEQKQAIIHRAVTRGLDPSVPLKPSGISWLGNVPQHWEVRRLRASTPECVNGVWGDDPDGEHDLTCVRVADFDRPNLRVNLRRKTTRAIRFSDRGRRLLQPGDLLLEKSGGGERQPVGAVVLFDSDEPAVCSNFVARMAVAPGYHSGFLNYLHAALYALRMTVPSVKQTTGIQNLDGKSYLSEQVAFPDRDEQGAISSFLDGESRRLAQAISRLEREIELLREYRTRLVADVVTGKLDVREAAARLPKEAAAPVGEVEPADDLDSEEEDVE